MKTFTESKAFLGGKAPYGPNDMPMPMMPYLPPPPQSAPVEAAAGFGEYVTTPDAALEGPPMASPMPFEASAGMGMMGMDPSGIGSYVTYPVRARSKALQVAAAVSPLAGALGQVSDAIEQKNVDAAAGKAGTAITAGLIIGLVGVGLVLRGGAGYIVGQALAPDEDDETAYAWGGVLASLLLGSVGLGIEALVAKSQE